MELLKKEVCSVFKPQFKLKVVDTLRGKEKFANIQFYDITEESYEDLKEGTRLRIVNSLTPYVHADQKQKNFGDGSLFLIVNRNSRLINMTEIYHRKKNQQDEIEQHKQLIEKELFPLEYKLKGEVMDYIHLYAKVLKVISPKKNKTGFQEVRNIIALTHE